MATNPKMKPCYRCKSDGFLAVYSYDSGRRYVECDKCGYRGEGSTNIREAIKLHNGECERKARANQQEGERNG